jgi:signal transduction histidine kinase
MTSRRPPPQRSTRRVATAANEPARGAWPGPDADHPADRVEQLRHALEAGERQRAELTKRLAQAEQEERRRLALLLHDGPQQLLTSIGLTLDAAMDAFEDGAAVEARRLLAVARRRNQQAAADLRHLGAAIEPVALRQQGLAAAVRLLTRSLAEAHDVRFDIDLAGAERLDQSQRTLVYQIVREALSNAIKHARPGRIAIHSRHSSADGLSITIRDDGRGMQRLQAADGLGQGTRTMRERAAALGATVEWITSARRGTTVRLSVPAGRSQSLAA